MRAQSEKVYRPNYLMTVRFAILCWA